MNTASAQSPTMFDYSRHVLESQRTAKGLEQEMTIARLKMAFNSSDALKRQMEDAAKAGRAIPVPEGLDSIMKAQSELHAFASARDNAPDAVHIDATMKELSIRFTNDEYIGDRLMPVATVGQLSNKFYIYNERDQLAYPNDILGPRGQATEVSQGYTTDTYTCQERGLQGYVDMSLVKNADMPLNPLMDMTMLVNDGIAWNRENRIAGVLTTGANFGSNTFAPAAGQEWNANSSGDPNKLVQKAIDSVFGGPGVTKLIGYCSVNVFRILSRHPAIRELFKYTETGFATAQQIASFYGLDALLVGRGRKDSANSGQTRVDARIWADVFGIVRVAQNPSPYSYCFGTTFRDGPMETSQTFKKEAGRSGGYTVKVTYAETHKIVAQKAGYLLTGIVDPALL